MKLSLWIVGALVIGLLGASNVEATLLGEHKLYKANRDLHGEIIDFTHNHGADRRIWSDALGEKRDLYVYLPPGFNPATRYPFAIFLHGAMQDEEFFLKAVKLFDQAIADGKIPPVIVAAPDGSLQGRMSWYHSASFWANTRAGRFEDWVMQDVWHFMMTHYPLRPEREAHTLVGVSMGGAGAYALAMRHRDKVKIAIGFAPALNLRWVDCHGHYRVPFRPDCWGWREEPHCMEIIGRPLCVLPVRFHTLFGPIIGHGPEAIAELARINPTEILEACNLQPGDLDLYVAYGGKDEFNIGAQVESFRAVARPRGIQVEVDFDPNGRHDYATGARMFPKALEWAAKRMRALGPMIP